MKKLNILFILAAGLTLTLSCNRDEGRFEPEVEQFKTVTITAGAADTKTVLDGDAVKWENEDKVALAFTHATKSTVVEEFSTTLEESSARADFTGTISHDVYGEGSGYEDKVHVVYPASALTAQGAVAFTLPKEQKVLSDGSFASGLNLSYAVVSLNDLRDDAKASATFHNALSVLRFALEGNDVTSVTLTGTASLAGAAPIVYGSDGKLAINAGGSWTNASQTVTLKPAGGAECFTKGQMVNLLVWPGAHTSMIVTLEFKNYGQYQKSSSAAVTFEPSKYYTLDFNADSETLVKELDEHLDDLEPELSELEDQLSVLETNAERIDVLVDQIQSVALMSEYLENSAYAYYANQSIGMLKLDVKLTYMVRPAAAMELLLEICNEEGNLSEVLSMMCDNGTGSFSTLNVKDAILEGDILTVVISGEQFDRNFYDGRTKASVALQISDGNTDIISDFATLVPKVGTILNFSRVEDIPVLKGASFSMSYQYGAADYSKCEVSVSGVGFSTAPTISAKSGNGFISAKFDSNANLSGMSMTVTLKYDGEVADVKTLTFADGGTFSISTPASVDYIGGEVAVNVTSSDFSSYNMQLSGAGDWIYETSSGLSGRYTLNQNNGSSQRSASVVVTIDNGSSISYSKSVTITQKAAGTPLTGNYYNNGEKILLNQKTASCANALNIVILGDGYQKKDLLKGGKFERSARSAMDSFFGVEPYKTFKDRFNVYMVAYESTDEGVDIKASAINKNTYFDTYCEGGGNTAAYTANVNKVVSVVKSVVGSSDAQYYRTIAIVLANTSEQAGSCGYPYRERYNNTSTLGEEWASFSICVLAANSTGTNGLVKHEAGGHAFGRLADEYYNGGAITSDKISELNTWHNKGWYFNVCTDRSYWNFFIGRSGYEDVGYIEGAWGYASGIYRPTVGGMMQNNTGVFNAPSRRAIYQRIIRQTEGYNAYSDAKFLEYDKKNL